MVGPPKKVSVVALQFRSHEGANDGSPYLHQNHPTRHPAKTTEGQHIHGPANTGVREQH